MVNPPTGLGCTERRLTRGFQRNEAHVRGLDAPRSQHPVRRSP